LFDELVCLVDEGQRLLQIDDVDAVAVGEDEPLHLGVPATGLMPEVCAAVKQLLHGYDGHACAFVCRLSPSDGGSRGLAAAGMPDPLLDGTAGMRCELLVELETRCRRAKSARNYGLRRGVYTLRPGALSTALAGRFVGVAVN